MASFFFHKSPVCGLSGLIVSAAPPESPSAQDQMALYILHSVQPLQKHQPSFPCGSHAGHDPGTAALALPKRWSGAPRSGRGRWGRRGRSRHSHSQAAVCCRRNQTAHPPTPGSGAEEAADLQQTLCFNLLSTFFYFIIFFNYTSRPSQHRFAEPWSWRWTEPWARFFQWPWSGSALFPAAGPEGPILP